MREVLFLCTGNYYRSRFAEACFNHEATRRELDWRAFSRGLAAHLAPPDGLSPHTIRRLRVRRIPRTHTGLKPTQVTESDLQRASRIVALKEKEHRPLLAGLHPGWESRVEYWHIDDLDSAPSGVALAAIERQVLALLAELESPGDGSRRGGGPDGDGQTGQMPCRPLE